jgi:hypothetical protein
MIDSATLVLVAFGTASLVFSMLHYRLAKNNKANTSPA